MAALTTVAVSARSPKSCTITFNAAAITCTGHQLKQLESVIKKLMVECSADMPSDTGAVVTGI